MKLIHADKDELNFPHSPEVLNALKSISSEVFARYQKESELLDFLSEYHSIPKERLFLETGVIGVIHRVFDYRLSKNSSVLLPEFGYPYYQKLSKHHNANIQTFRFFRDKNSFSYDIEDLIKKLKAHPDIAVIIDPEAPLGFSTPEEKIRKILEATPQDTLVVLDNTHEGFRKNKIDAVKLTNNFPNLLVTQSFSKFYGLAGVRIGYAICGKNVKKMANFKERYLGFDGVAQKLAIAALKSKEHYKKNVQLINEQKQHLESFVRKIKGCIVFKTDSLYLVIEIPEEKKGKLKKAFEENNIAVRWLGDYWPELKNFVRITTTPEEQTNSIIKVFQKIQG